MNADLKNNHWCPYYNQGLYIGSNQLGQSLIAMCCWQQKIQVDHVRFDDPSLEKSRHQSNTGIPSSCSNYCKIPGHIANERERSINDACWDRTGKYIKKLHLEQSLLCNLTCISCSSRYSSAWNTHYRHFDPTAQTIKLKKDVDSVWKDLDLSHVEALHFTGGEPLLNDDNLKILEHLDSLGRLEHVTATYNTNGTIRVSDQVLKLWHKMKWIRLHVSLDGHGSTFEYTRYPAKWDEVSENIQWYRQLKGPCILIEVNAIVGIHNIFNLPDFYNWWVNNCQTGNQGDPSNIFVRSIEPSSYGGKVLSLEHLPIELQPMARDVLYSLHMIPGVPGLIPIISKRPDTQWIDYFNRLDNLRNTDWKKDLSPNLDYDIKQ